MDRVLVSSAVDCGIEILKMGIYCFSAKHTPLSSRAKTVWLGIRIMCPIEACWCSAMRTSLSLHQNVA